MPKKRTKEELLKRLQEKKQFSRFCNRKRGRTIATRSQTDKIDEENFMIPFVIVSKNNAGERYDWWEDEVYIEELDPNGANFEELRTMFKDHRTSVDTAIASVKNKGLEDGEVKVDVFFGKDEDSQKIFQKYRDEILTDVSIGYFINDLILTHNKDEPDHVLVSSYDIVELSAVWKGFDSGATVGRQKEEKKEKTDTGWETDLLKRKLNLKMKGIKL